MAAFFAQDGWTCIDVDNVNAPGDDLVNDALWEEIFAGVLEDKFHFIWMGPPCSSFSPARRYGPGPRPIRDAKHCRGFPKAWLSDAEVEELRVANYFVVQCCRLGALALSRKCGWAIENPTPWDEDECTSMFEFEEFVDLMQRPGVRTIEFSQCMIGADTNKPTRVVFFGIDLGRLKGDCAHRPRWWWCEHADNSGRRVEKWLWAPHPKLIKKRGPDGSWASKAAAAYPGRMNALVAKAVVEANSTALAVGPREPGAS